MLPRSKIEHVHVDVTARRELNAHRHGRETTDAQRVVPERRAPRAKVCHATRETRGVYLAGVGGRPRRRHGDQAPAPRVGVRAPRLDAPARQASASRLRALGAHVPGLRAVEVSRATRGSVASARSCSARDGAVTRRNGRRVVGIEAREHRRRLGDDVRRHAAHRARDARDPVPRAQTLTRRAPAQTARDPHLCRLHRPAGAAKAHVRDPPAGLPRQRPRTLPQRPQGIPHARAPRRFTPEHRSRRGRPRPSQPSRGPQGSPLPLVGAIPARPVVVSLRGTVPSGVWTQAGALPRTPDRTRPAGRGFHAFRCRVSRREASQRHRGGRAVSHRGTLRARAATPRARGATRAPRGRGSASARPSSQTAHGRARTLRSRRRAAPAAATTTTRRTAGTARPARGRGAPVPTPSPRTASATQGRPGTPRAAHPAARPPAPRGRRPAGAEHKDHAHRAVDPRRAQEAPRVRRSFGGRAHRDAPRSRGSS